MPRTHVIDQHEQWSEIVDSIVSGEPEQVIADRYGLAKTTVHDYKSTIADRIKKYTQDRDGTALDTIKRYIGRAEKLWRACDKFLRDADDPDEYDLGPRDHDIEVTYLDFEEGVISKGAPKKAMLSQLLDKTGKHVIGSKYRIADPRELVLKSLERLESQLRFLGGLTGEVKPNGPTFNGPVQINLDAAPLLGKALKAVPCECGKTVDARGWVLKVLRGE